MKKHLSSILVISMIVAMILAPIQPIVSQEVCTRVISTNDSKPLVVCTTSVLASIVEDLAGEYVEARYLVSPSMCPGHYDIKPGDVATIRNASIILAHGMEWGGWLRELITSANQTGDLHVPIFNLTGPWNTPVMLKQKYQTVASKLSEVLGLDLSNQLSKCLNAIDKVDSEIMGMVDEYGFNGTPVASMLWQKGFVEYLGFKVVAVYGPTEFLSQSDIEEIEVNITTYNAKLIIDNLQSGVEVGRKIAEDTGIVQVVLINFPGSVVGVNNVTEMMLYNVRLLADGLKFYEYRVELASYKSAIDFWQYTAMGIALLAVIEVIIIIMLIVRTRKHE